MPDVELGAKKGKHCDISLLLQNTKISHRLLGLKNSNCLLKLRKHLLDDCLCVPEASVFEVSLLEIKKNFPMKTYPSVNKCVGSSAGEP